jgi:predicted metalloprotease with PDZ domain
MLVRHQVALSDPNAHLVTVCSTFTAATDERFPEPFVVAMPVWTPGSYLVREYARHVEAPRAVADGAPTQARKVRKNAWSITHRGAREIVFEYELYCNELTVRTNHADATHVYLNGAASFCFAAHEPALGAVVALALPDAFRIATPLAPGRAPGELVAASYDELVDAPIEAGLHQTRSFEALGRPHTLAIWGEAPAANWDDVVRDTKALVETEARLFDGELPYDRYAFLWLITPRTRGGLEHRDGCTLTVTPQLFEDRKGYLDLLSLVAHELFHLWNVKRIRPAGLAPYRYEEENYTRLLWWFEGATSYYDWRALRVAGLCTVDEYLEHLGEEIARLEDTPGRAAQSCAEASFDAWIKLYRVDENTVNSTVSYYLKGEIVCALLDVEIRVRTQGRRALDDVLALLWREHGKEERPVPEDAMPEIFERAVGLPMDDLLAAWVEGRGELPIDAVLARVGLELRRDRDGKRPRGALGIRVRPSEGRAIVTSVLRGRAGHRAGLDAGDEILSVGGRRVEGGKVDAALIGRAPGSEVEVVIARDGTLRTLRATLDPWPTERVRIAPSETASATQRSLLEGWLHGTPSVGAR